MMKTKTLFNAVKNSSVLWGTLATFAFYFALQRGWIRSETLVRYCAGHPVEYATTGMFWIGLCDLALTFARTFREKRGLRRGLLFAPKTSEKEPTTKVDGYLKTLEKARAVRGDSAYLTRLADALDFLKFGGSPDDLDQELRFLADDAADRADSQYGMVKTFVWAIPILGFLGTVLGVTLALGSLDLTQLEATGALLAAGLKVAFDTTALALSLVFILYFAMFFVRKQETALADAITRSVDAELKGRFVDVRRRDDADSLEEAESTRRILRAVAAAFEETTRTQAAIWADATTDVTKKSVELSNAAASRLADALDAALKNASASWVRTLAEAQRDFVDSAIRPALEETARRTVRFDALEEKVAQETQALLETLRASADVVALEDRLTQTLEKIAEVGAFEKTLNNLSATVCLLNSKLTASTLAPPPKLAERSGVRRDAIIVATSPDEAAKKQEIVRKQAEAFAALDALENDLGDDAKTLAVRNFAPETPSEPALEASRSSAKKKRPA